MSWLLLLPNWLKIAAAGLLVLGVLQVRHWWTVRGLSGQIEQLTVALALEKGATADLKVGIADVSGDRDKWVVTSKQQSADIDRLHVQSTQIESRLKAAAEARVLRAFRDGEASAAALRAPTTRINPGHEAMTLWFTERFAR